MPSLPPDCYPSRKAACVTATILDGKRLAQQIQAELTEEVAEFIENNGVDPTLAAVLVGEDPASEVYIRNKQNACEAVGIESRLHRLPANVSQDELLALSPSSTKPRKNRSMASSCNYRCRPHD